MSDEGYTDECELIAHISQIRLFAKWGNANPTRQSMGEETKNEWK